MNTVESVDRSAVPRVSRTMSTLLDVRGEVFAGVFESARLSADRLAEVMTQQARDAAGTSRRHEQLAEALSESGRCDALRGRSGRQLQGEPSRVDKLRSLVNEDQRGPDQTDEASAQRETDGLKGARDRAAEVDRQAQTEAREYGVGDGVTPERVQDAAQDGTTMRPQQVAEAAADVPTQNAGSAADSGQRAGSQGPGDQAAPRMPGPMTTPGGPTESLNRTPVVQSAPNVLPGHQQGQATGREAGSGQSQDAAPSHGGKAGSASGRPNAPSVDFQNVLRATGRPGGRFAAVRSGALPVGVEGNSRAVGINLDESRSITELARIVRANIGSRHSTMTLRLDPPELGHLRIDVRMHDQMLTLRVEAETLAGHEAVRSRVADLRSTLEQHGIQLSQVDVEFRPPSLPAGGSQDLSDQQQSTPQWGESSSGGPEGHGGPGARSDLSGSAHQADEPMTVSGGSGLSEDEGPGGVQRPAEPGVDLVV